MLRQLVLFSLTIAGLGLVGACGDDDPPPPPETDDDDDDIIVDPPPPPPPKLDYAALSDRTWLLPDMTFGAFTHPAFVGPLLGSLYDAQAGPAAILQRRSGHGIFFTEAHRWTVTPIGKSGLESWFDHDMRVEGAEATESELAVEIAVRGSYALVLPNVTLELSEIRTTLRFDAELNPEFPEAETRFRFAPQPGTVFEGMCVREPGICDEAGTLEVLTEEVSYVEIQSPSMALGDLSEGCEEGPPVDWSNIAPFRLRTQPLEEGRILQPPGAQWRWPGESVALGFERMESGDIEIAVGFPGAAQETILIAHVGPGGCFSALSPDETILDPDDLKIQTHNWILAGRINPDFKSAEEIAVGFRLAWPEESPAGIEACDRFPFSCATNSGDPFLITGLSASAFGD